MVLLNRKTCGTTLQSCTQRSVAVNKRAGIHGPYTKILSHVVREPLRTWADDFCIKHWSVTLFSTNHIRARISMFVASREIRNNLNIEVLEPPANILKNVTLMRKTYNKTTPSHGWNVLMGSGIFIQGINKNRPRFRLAYVNFPLTYFLYYGQLEIPDAQFQCVHWHVKFF